MMRPGDQLIRRITERIQECVDCPGEMDFEATAREIIVMVLERQGQ